MDFRMLSKVLLRFFVLFLQITVVKWETSKESKKHLINGKENRKKKGSITNFVGFPIPLVALSAHIE